VQIAQPKITDRQLTIRYFFYCFSVMQRDLRVGAVLREQNALPYKVWKTRDLTAKPDVDNVGAGRTAKGASPGRSTSSLFRRFVPYCLNHNKAFMQ
jgi:hypothetical protein